MGTVAMAGIRLDAADVPGVAAFWAGVLQCHTAERPDGVSVVVPRDPSNYPILVSPADTPKHGQNRIHLDLTSPSDAAMHDTVARARDLGGGPIDIGQSPSERHSVLADPEGNELCVIEPGNRFLAETGAVGAINCDGTQALGYFWSRALDWPLVWDEDEETAIQSPRGGSKITWSGPPLMPRAGRERWRFELEAVSSMTESIERLVTLGARLSSAESAAGTTLIDPDGNEFHLLEPGATALVEASPEGGTPAAG